jgi:hypothetical protein
MGNAIKMWRTHSCVPRSHSCERMAKRPQEWGRGTHECVRHIMLQTDQTYTDYFDSGSS